MDQSNPIEGFTFRIAAALICMTCIFYTAVMRRFNKKKLRSRLFLTLLVLTLIDCFTGIFVYIFGTSQLPYILRLLLTYFFQLLYYLTHIAFIALFVLYIVVVCDMHHNLTARKLLVIFLPFWILELGVFTNPFTNFIFSVDKNLVYRRGVGIYVAYVVSIIYVLYSIYLLARYWRSMNNLQKFAMLYFFGLSFTGMAIQLFNPQIICELFAESLGLMGIMIMIERDDYRIDCKTHAYNRSALLHDLRSCFEMKRHFFIICVRLINAEVYRRVVGYRSYDMIMEQVANFLSGLHENYDVYRTTGGNFYLLCPDISAKKADELLDKIANRFGEDFRVENGTTRVNPKILCASCPEQLTNPNDILLFSASDLEESGKTVLKGGDLNFLLRRVDVEKAIVRGLEGESFKVMYQPVYDKNTLKIHSAEALLTLNDMELGEISFSEFMSVSEDTGFVMELEYRMIDAVCRFVNTGVEHSDINSSGIVIHIMSLQVLTQELVNRVREYVNAYDIDPSILVFDVSDTIAVHAQEFLLYIIDEFSKMGIRFVLVNNDSGFLGLNHSVIAKFDGVTINVKKHYALSDNEQSDIILRNRTAMVHQLGKVVILSGVDSRELFERVRNIPADNIVGNYLSKMVSKNELQNKFWHAETLDYIYEN